MRLLELHLEAFGPFHDRRIDLSAGEQGLHLLYGPNEAGKSSALRALRAWLFGIPERTTDNFQHSNDQLRVGGRLRAASGEELLCYRVKKRKRSLQDADGAELPEERLATLLGAIDERGFSRLFGIDLETLVAGGQELLAEAGREAEALFSSGSGSRNLSALRQQFEAEADALFRPRGQVKTINRQLADLKELERRQRDSQLAPSAWEAARQRLEQAIAECDALTQALRLAERERGRLERLRRTLPLLAKAAHLRARLAELGAAPRLPEDFGRRREQAESQERLATAAVVRARDQIADLVAKLEALPIDTQLLTEAETIESLRERLGSHRKAATDREGLVASRRDLEQQAASLLAQVRPGLDLAAAPAQRPLLSQRPRVADLGATLEVKRNAVAEAQTRLIAVQAKLAGKEEALGALPPVPELDRPARTLAAAHRQGDLDRQRADAEAALEAHEARCERELQALGLWRADLAALARAPWPADVQIETLAVRLERLQEAARRLQDQGDVAREERRRLEEQIRAIALGGAVPSEELLSERRAHRDAGWALVKAQWLDGEPPGAAANDYAGDPAPQALASAFATAMLAADGIADRLRRESQRVSELASLQARRETQAQQDRDSVRDLAALEAEQQALWQEWQTLWRPCALEPLAPRAMQAWLLKARRLGERVEEGAQLRASRDRLCGLHDQACGALRELLKVLASDPAESGVAAPSDAAPAATATPVAASPQCFADLLADAESRLARLEDLARRREQVLHDRDALREDRRHLELTLAERQRGLDQAQQDWHDLMATLGMTPDASPAAVIADLETLDRCLGHLENARMQAERIAGIDADAARFSADAAALVSRLAPDLTTLPLDAAIPALGARLLRQREDQSRHEALQQQAADAAAQVKLQEAERQAAEQELQALCLLAGCAHRGELAPIERRAREQDQLTAALREVETELMSAGDGLDLGRLQADAEGADQDAIRAELQAVQTRIEQDLRPKEQALLAAKLEAERVFAAMRGDDAAAQLAEEAEQLLSGLRANAERYLRAKLAARILRDAIEHFRRQHRDPILASASGYFQRLTCGAFQGIVTEFDDDDQPILKGVRAAGERLTVGAMSTGTRDQLYLALRLANLEHRGARAEPLPLIVDDILVQFDDARSRATLQALADFSATTQVILFSHHQHLVAQAQALDPQSRRIFVHQLAAAAEPG